MHLVYNNVNAAFHDLMTMAYNDLEGITSQNHNGWYFGKENTRNGEAMVMRQLLAITYANPKMYILQNSIRNANPFFHFIEAVWMFAGCESVTPLHYFCKQIMEYSDDSDDVPLYANSKGVRKFNGAYGYRWRHNSLSKEATSKSDQLLTIINILKEKPLTRRAVLQIWDPERDLDTNSKDIPCNMSCVFQVHGNELDMTVYNRSNDLVWGMLGSNVVHFSMLHEFMATSTYLPMGRYTHVTCNAHVYERHWPLLNELRTNPQTVMDGYSKHIPVQPTPRLYPTDPQVFLINCEKFIGLLQQYIHIGNGPLPTFPFRNVWSPCGNPFLDLLGVSLVDAWVAHKHRKYTRANTIISTNLKNTQWEAACINWLIKAEERRNRRNA